MGTTYGHKALIYFVNLPLFFAIQSDIEFFKFLFE